MGRKPVDKKRTGDPAQRAKWVEILMPKYLSGELLKTTMDKIAKLLGVSKAKLYRHFSSSREIIAEVVRCKVLKISSFEEALFNEKIPFEQRYEEAVQVASFHMAGISPHFLLELKEKYPDLWQQIDDFVVLVTERFTEFYESGIQQGILKEFSPKFLALTDKIFITALSDPQFLIDNQLSLQHSLNEYFAIKGKGIFKTT